MLKSNVIIRPGETKDIPAIIETSLSVNPWKIKHNLLGAESEKTDKSVNIEAEIEMYQKWINNQKWSTEGMRIFVAEVSGKVLGYMLLARTTPKYFADTNLKQMYLADIVVHRDHAGQGVGDTMIEWMKFEAAKLDIEVIRAECSKGKLEKWYWNHGFISVPYHGNALNYPVDTHTMLEMPKEVYYIDDILTI